MTSNHHTPFADDYALTKANWNIPPSGIDSIITDIAADNQQFTGVLVGGGALDADSLLGGTSTTKGYRLPVMTETQRDAIATPTTGLMVINSTAKTIDFYNGSAWTAIGTTAGASARTLIASGEDTNVAQVDIQSIPATYQDLILIMQTRSLRAAQNNDELWVRFNGDSGVAYDAWGDWWNSGTTNAFSSAGASAVTILFNPAANEDAEWEQTAIMRIPGYARVSLSLGGWLYASHRVEPLNVFYRIAAMWAYQHASSTIVDEINIVGRFANIDCRYQLYGIGVAT